MNKKDVEFFKKKLLAEKSELEEELSEIGQKDPSQPGGWEATSGNIEVDAADENEVADKLEEFESNTSLVTQLENQLTEVKAALERVEAGKYGLCEVCGKPIEKERLEASPSARVSIKHSHK
jgi:RNA polymerase-binding transcription factor DksA